MKKSRASIVLATIMALVLVLAACSKKDDTAEPSSGESTAAESTDTTTTSSPDEYATAVCGALSDWLTGIQESSSTMSPDMTDLDEGQAQLVTFLEGLTESTDAMIATVEAAGAPDVEGGEEAAEQMLASLTNVQTIFATATETVSDLDTSDPKAFGKALQQIGTDMQDASSGATAGLDSITSEELNEAFATNSECTSLGAMG